MIVPNPPVKLEDHCSVIHDNTLYTYSANGFASIPLKENGNWTVLDMGEPVSGAACVQGAMGHSNKQALYVIGGSGSSSKNYPGLQRYSFQDEEWETMNPTSEDMSNRTNHGAVYLKASSSIFVYAGNKDGSSTATSDTFVINTAYPQNVSSYSGADASPASNPVLLPWSDDRAALVGGATAGRKVHLFKFNGTGDWSDSGVVLPQVLPKEVRCAMVNNNDGSKILESFGMNLTPNTVDSLALVDSEGKALNPAKPVGTSSRKRRRAAVDNYPTYDGKFAASKTWSQYSLAQGEDSKLVVISGGGDRHSLAVFNQTSNSWMNSTKLFYGDQTMQQILPSTTSSTDATATSSSSPSSTPPPVSGGSGSSSSKTGTIVGATLGSVIGAAVIVIALIFCLRRKNKGNAAAQGKSGSTGNKDRLSIQDQGIEPLTQSAYPMAKSQAPLGSSSVDSLAIFSGKLADEKKTQASPAAHPVYGPKGAPAKSPLSTVQSSRELLSHQNTPTADKAFETGQTGMGGQPGDRRTDEGWTKYFQDNDVDNTTTDARDMQHDQPTASEDLAKSERRGSAWPMTNLTPLNFGFLDEPKPLGQVVTGSPTTEHTSSATDGQNLVIPEGQAARISSGDSLSLASDDNSEYDRRRSRYSSGMTNDNYVGRPVSSMYSESHYYNPSGAPIGYGYDPVRSSQPRRSSVIIPDTLEENAPAIRKDNANSDMSWLNLQADR